MVADLITAVAEQCATHADSVAVKRGKRELTYRELNQRSDMLAVRLQSQGVVAGDCCAVSVACPTEAIIAFLAALKIGACYVPFDDDLPDSRKRFLLAETNAKCLLAAGVSRYRGWGVETCDIRLDEPLTAWRSAFPLHQVRQSDPAYVIYTSGSSGRPKGVKVSRGNLTYSTLARHSYYRSPVNKFLLVSPLTFDSSVAGLYWTLTTGGTLVLPDRPINQHVDAIVKTIKRNGVSHLLCIPSLWNLLLDKLYVQALQGLETVIVAGEACPRQLVKQHHQLLPETTLYNEYGPTEATVWCSVHRTTSQDGDRTVPIGKSIAGTTIYLLDADGAPVPPNAEGEICVAGPGVALEYVGDPDLTRQRFAIEPIAGQPIRMYKTGDFGRMSIDGTITFLGRHDGQLKIRGHRIESEEIESALRSHPEVRESAVIKISTDGAAGLAGFVVPSNGRCPDTRELKDYLSRSLPDYMIPAKLLRCEQIPRTKHGKVDQHSLRRRAQQGGCDEEQATAKRPTTVVADGRSEATELNGVRAELVEKWQQLFGHSNVGVDDRFFDLGGDSLLGLELVAFIQRRFDRRVELPQLLTHGTIRQLARLIEEPVSNGSTSCLIPIQAQGSRRPLFCIHPGGGNVVCYAPLSSELGTDQPLYGIRAPGVEAGEDPLDTVPEMATEYIRLLRAVQTHGPYAIAGWSFGGIVSYEIAYQLEQAGESVCFLGVIDGSPVYSIAVLKEIFPDSTLSIAAITEAHAEQHFDQFYASAADAMLVTPDADREHTFRVLQLFASTMRAAVDYRPKSIQAPMTLMVAAEKLRKTKYDPYRDWRRTCDTIDVHQVPGHHLTMMKPPHVKTLAQKLRQLMTQAENGHSDARRPSSRRGGSEDSPKSLVS